MTLEMGSWAWVRKNPRQLGSRLGIFNPIKRHRLERTLRRHLPLLDLLFHAVASADAWTPDRDAMREQWTTEGFTRWY